MNWRKPNRGGELDRELQFHIEKLVQENIASGLSPEEARRQAALEFGGKTQLTEELYDVHRIPLLETAANNFTYALRLIRKSPSLSVTIILTLAFGIGANTAVFSAIDAILLRPLPFPNGDRLMSLAQHDPKSKLLRSAIAPIRLIDWSRMNSTFQAITGYYTEDVSETSGQLPEKLTRAWVASRFFEVWGISPALGRSFTPEEEQVPGHTAVVISDRFWRRRFAADSTVIGKPLRLEGHSWTIVGVMPASFLFPRRDVDLLCPAPARGALPQMRQITWFAGVGRLKPGVTIDQARADLATVQAQLGKQYPATDAELMVRIEPLKEVRVAGIRQSLWILFGSVSLLLLLACSNIASLLLARTTQRAREIAIRLALGASRAAVLTQLLAEVFVLALAGAALAVLMAAGASQGFHALAKDLPRAEEIRVDWTILLYTLTCAVGATLLCGLLPAWRATDRAMPRSLAQSSRTVVSARGPLQWALVGVQVALAVTLLVGAGLLLRSFQALGQVSPGFDPNHVLTFRISGNYSETFQALNQRAAHTLDALRNVPGVQAAASSGDIVPGTPLQYIGWEMKISGQPISTEHKILATPRYVSAGYFATMHIPLLAGELCRDSLTLNSAMVNRSFVDTYLSGAGAIGKTVEFANPGFYNPPPAEIRGIVADAREQGLNHEPAPVVYWCESANIPTPFFLVRTNGDPMAMAGTLRRKLHEIEPARSMFDVTPLSERLADSFAENRLRTILLTFFAFTAVLLACIGLYGTLSYFVNVRRREVGLRLAMGAHRGQIVRQFLLYGFRASLCGCAAGLALASASTRLLRQMLFGISSRDTTTFAAVLLLMLLTTAAASFLPALRASRVDPMTTLRDE